MLSGSRLLPSLRYRTNEGWQVLGGCRWLPVMRSSGLMYGLVRRPYERNRNFAVFYQDAIPFFLSWAQFSGSCFHVKSLMGGLVFELDIISLVYGGGFQHESRRVGILDPFKGEALHTNRCRPVSRRSAMAVGCTRPHARTKRLSELLQVDWWPRPFLR